jgi:hypothetical protein
MFEYINRILDPFLRKLFAWIQKTTLRIFIFVFSLVLLGALVAMTLKWLEFSNVFGLINYVGSIVWKLLIFSQTGLIAALYAAIFMLFVNLRGQGRKSSTFDIRFGKEGPEEYFIISPDSSWDLVPDEETPFSKVLSVTNSGFVGHLKKGAEWCDYRLKFKAKIKSNSNFSFAIRVADKNNAIFFQCSGKNIYPHLIMNGITVRYFNDARNAILPFGDIALPLAIPNEKWVDVLIEVRGKTVLIEIDGMRKEYQIPSFLKYVYANAITPVMDYSLINNMHKEINEKIERAGKLNEEINGLIKSLEGGGQEGVINSEIKKKREEIESIQKSYGATITSMGHDYERGTIGFREWGPEHALFKDIRVELLDKI